MCCEACASAYNGARMTLISGAKLGPYEIQSLLGAGGMGEVYLALDSRLKREVAIKILPAHLTSDSELRARFTQEAQAVCALRHPNICVVHDIGSQNGVDFMVMEFVTGGTLNKVIQGGLPANVALVNVLKMSIIEHFSRGRAQHHVTVKTRELTPKQILSVPCTICGAAIGEACELHTGAQRTEPHRDRKLSAAEDVEMKPGKR